MLEVVFSDSAAGTMAVAIGHKGFLGGATSVIISDGTVSKEEIEKFQHQAEERERSGWENAIPLEGNRKDIVNLPLALSVGNISEAGICLERESALSLLLSILPDMASEIVTELLNTSRKNYATLLEKAQNGEPIRVWVGRDPDDVCGLYWLLEQLRPIGLEMSRNVQSGNTQNLKSMVIQRSFPKWSVAERRKTAAASNQAACCACTHSRYLAGGSPSGLRV